jgi:hypothetical protein
VVTSVLVPAKPVEAASSVPTRKLCRVLVVMVRVLRVAFRVVNTLRRESGRPYRSVTARRCEKSPFRAPAAARPCRRRARLRRWPGHSSKLERAGGVAPPRARSPTTGDS